MRILRRKKRSAYPDDLSLKVLQHHIDTGERSSQTKCPVSQAFREMFPEAEPWTHHDGIYVWGRDRRGRFRGRYRCVEFYNPVGGEHENFTHRHDDGGEVGPAELKYRRMKT